MHQSVPIGIEVAGTDIIVPRNKRERLGDAVMIEAIEPTHKVSGDELTRLCTGTNGVNLRLLIARPAIGNEIFPFEHQSWIGALLRNRNLAPVVVGLAPVSSGPMRVEVFDGLEFFLQPILKLLSRAFIVGHQRVAVFVVDLPADDVRVVPIVLRHLLRNAAAEFAVLGRGGRSVCAASVLHALAVHFHAKRFRIFESEPRRRRGGGRSHNRNNVVLCGERDGAVKPLKFEMAFGRFHSAPRKFRNANGANVRGFHQLQIFFPSRFRPLFRIPRNAHEQRRLARELSRRRNRILLVGNSRR